MSLKRASVTSRTRSKAAGAPLAGCVPAVLLHGGDDELVIDRTAVDELEADLLAALHFNPVGGEQHLAVRLVHGDLDDAIGLFRVARPAICGPPRWEWLWPTAPGPARAMPVESRRAASPLARAEVLVINAELLCGYDDRSLK
jgi:hypothetical protein